MLNVEKYEEEIKKEIANFRNIPCIVKDLKDGGCGESRNCVTCSMEMLHWLSQEYKEPIKPILTDKDKIIIKDIIKAFEPFGKKLKYITKFSWNIETKGYYLNFEYKGDDFDTFNFSEDEFFVGMELDKAYTPEELGL